MCFLVPLLIVLTKLVASKMVPVFDVTSRIRHNEAPFLSDIERIFNDLDSSNESPASSPEINIDKLSSVQEPDELDSKFQSILQDLIALEELRNKHQLDDSILKEETESLEEEDDEDLTRLSSFLISVLQKHGSWRPPRVLIEEPVNNILEDPKEELKEESNVIKNLPTAWKRSSLYYRRYPWKRQTSRYRDIYDYNSPRYLCTPTREDIFQLLVALHDVRQGNKSRIVNFCNRRTPASSIFTNIRFLGRRK